MRVGALVIAVVAAAVAAGVLIAGTGGGDPAAAPPPVGERGGAAALRIPDGALRLDAQSRAPIPDPDARWVRSEGRRLTPLLGRCESGAPASIAARQVALVERTLWKAERVSVYRDAHAARTTVARLRRCGDHENRDGTRTEWSVEPLRDVGDEAVFVASVRRRDGDPVAGAHRGVVARAGRAIVWLVDFGPGPRRMQGPADVPRYASYARASAQRLAAARWLE